MLPKILTAKLVQYLYYHHKIKYYVDFIHIFNPIQSLTLNPIQSLQSLLDSVVTVDDADDEEAGNYCFIAVDFHFQKTNIFSVELLTQLEESVSLICVYFRETTAPAPNPLPQATPNFSQVLHTNLTKSGSTIPTSPPPSNANVYNTNNQPSSYNANMYNSNTSGLKGYDSMDTPFTVSSSTSIKYPDYKAHLAAQAARSRENAAADIAAAAAATNNKKLNNLVRGKLCSSLAGVLANGIKKQLHLLSLKDNHVSCTSRFVKLENVDLIILRYGISLRSVEHGPSIPV